jgi:hypothetical protein
MLEIRNNDSQLGQINRKRLRECVININFPQGGFQHGEFDPGSELTLAARLKHASRTGVAIH